VKPIHYIVLFVTTSSLCFSQQFNYNKSIGEFKDASSFYINSAGIVFVTDDITDEVYQLDTLGNVIESIGGYGWDESAFDDPVDVFADPLKVLVADKNNNRIQRFDKNLNFIFQIYTRDSDNEAERFGYPVSAVTSNLGDVFILDSENKRILKFDPFGKFIQTIGGYDYGKYTLNNPKKLAISMENNIYVIDDNYVYIYDNYGTGINKFEINEEMISIRIIFNWLTLNSKEKIYITNLRSKDKILNEAILSGIDKNYEIVSSLIFNGKLYALTKKSILIFSPV
jgi:hypothetical protein